MRKFYETGDSRGIKPEHVQRFRLILARLDASQEPQDMDLPGLKIHGLKKRGKLDLRGHWGVAVSGNWRVTFRFEGRDAVDVNYLDYH